MAIHAYIYTQKYVFLLKYGTWSVSSYLLPASLSLCVFTTFEPTFEPARMTRKTIRPSVASGANAFEAFPSPIDDESTQANAFLPATTDCQTHEHSMSGQPFLWVPVHAWLESSDAHMLPQHFFCEGTGISNQMQCALQEIAERQKNHIHTTGTMTGAATVLSAMVCTLQKADGAFKNRLRPYRIYVLVMEAFGTVVTRTTPKN
jgi:hypothetical protein